MWKNDRRVGFAVLAMVSVSLIYGCASVAQTPAGDDQAMLAARDNNEARLDGAVMGVYLAGVPVNPSQSDEKTQQVFDVLAKKIDGFIDPETGLAVYYQSSLLLSERSPNEGKCDIRAETSAGEPACDVCAKAREKRQAYFDNGIPPPAFGQVVRYTLRTAPDSPLLNFAELEAERLAEQQAEDNASLSDWLGGSKFNILVGDVHLCSWIGDDEYYVELSFNESEGPGALRAYPHSGDPSRPFDGVLDMFKTKEELVELLGPGVEPELTREGIIKRVEEHGFKWKFSRPMGTGAMSVGVATINGKLFRSDRRLQLQSDCFDMFLHDIDSLGTRTVPTHGAYCIGRCDTVVVNTP